MEAVLFGQLASHQTAPPGRRPPVPIVASSSCLPRPNALPENRSKALLGPPLLRPGNGEFLECGSHSGDDGAALRVHQQ